MLESDPDAVASAFADPLTYTTDADGNTTSSVDTSASGAMAVLKVQLDKYAATTGATKGIRIGKSRLAVCSGSLAAKPDAGADRKCG